jgi:hypothetical protein
MKINDLLSPGLLSNGIKLRIEAAKAISSVQVTCMRTPGGKTVSAKTLADFFTDCASQLSSLHEETAPTITAQVATSATQINLTLSEAMDTSVVPALSAFAISGDTITAIAWTSSTNLRLTGTGFAAAESLVYTKPAVSYLRDKAGNALATVTKTLS